MTFRKTVVFKTEWKGKKGMPEYIGIIFKKCSIMLLNFCNVLRTESKQNRNDERKGSVTMSIERARAYLKEFGMEERIMELAESSATVELAAEALHCEPERIAKTLSFLMGEQPILIVAAGDARIDNHKYKTTFGTKAKMIPAAAVEDYIGHAVGGVCPFGIKEGIKVYLDESLKKFETVFPACGSGNSAIELTIPELEQCSGYSEWVNVCKEE